MMDNEIPSYFLRSAGRAGRMRSGPGRREFFPAKRLTPGEDLQSTLACHRITGNAFAFCLSGTGNRTESRDRKTANNGMMWHGEIRTTGLASKVNPSFFIDRSLFVHEFVRGVPSALPFPVARFRAEAIPGLRHPARGFVKVHPALGTDLNLSSRMTCGISTGDRAESPRFGRIGLEGNSALRTGPWFHESPPVAIVAQMVEG
jgi:hypothetical protein